MSDSQRKEENNDTLPKKSDGTIDWDKYYKNITPQVSDTFYEDVQKEPTFQPEYSDDPFLKANDIFQTMKEDGSIDFIDSPTPDLKEEELITDEIHPDSDFIEEEEDDDDDDDDDDDISKDLYLNPLPEEGDLFLIIIDEEGEVVDKLITVQSIQKDKLIIHFKDENQNDISLLLNDDMNIILRSDEYKYSILDFEKIQEINIKEIDNNEFFITKDIYPEIEIEVDELKEKVFSIQEKKESLITELISLLNAQDNKLLQFNICEISENYVTMLQENKTKSHDYSNQLSFLKDENYNLPSWLLPIVNNTKKLYIDDEKEPFVSHQDNTYVIFKDELEEKENTFSIEENTYQKYAKSITKFSPFFNKEESLLIPYNGHYMRDCNTINPCHGIHGEYIFDLNKTRGPAKIPLINDGKTYYETISPKEKISINGLYILPENYYDSTFKINDELSLYEKSLINSHRYPLVPLNQKLIYNQIVPHTIGPDTLKEDFFHNSIHSYIFNETVTQNNLKQTLSQNLPTTTDIIQSTSERLLSKIYNYNDFNQLFLPYGIKYHSVSSEDRLYINQLIKSNIQKYILDYNKSVKRKPLKKIKVPPKILTTKDKINLSKDFIFSILNIPLQNHYIQEFIKVFSRQPLANEDINYLYEKDSEDILLCKHYTYSCKLTNDPDTFLTMKTLFGDVEKDGIIPCKICGGYLCHQDFSILEGFSDNAPKNTREKLETDTNNLRELNDKQLLIKKRIQKLSSFLGIELNNHDQYLILDYFDTVNNDEIIDQRYKNTNSFKRHPTYKEIKKKYKFNKSPKTKEEKRENKITMEKLDKELNQFKEYLIDGNELLLITFLILFYLQVSYPPYEIKGKDILNLWDPIIFKKNSWNEINTLIHNKVSMKTINKVFVILDKLSSMNKKDTFWNNAKRLFMEESKHKSLMKVKGQFLQVSHYVLRDSKLRAKLKDHYNILNDLKTNLFLREYWPSFRPLPDNTTVTTINKKINEQLEKGDIQNHFLKKGVTINYENISTIQSIQEAYSSPKYVKLNIPSLEIMKNESYKKLLDYSIHLHGTSKGYPTINLLIHQFINTVDDKQIIEKKMESIGWNKVTKELQRIDFNQFRNVLLKEIPETLKKKFPKEKDTIETYNYIQINNWNGMLLNSRPKRFYNYKTPIVFPEKSYSELKDIHDNLLDEEKEEEDSINIIQSLFNKYCLDDNGNINKKVSHDEFILNIVADPSFERELNCHKSIDITEENFYKILAYTVESNKIELTPEIEIEDFIYEKRLQDFIIQNNLLNYPGDTAYDIFRKIHNLYNLHTETTDTNIIKNEYRSTFNMIDEYKNQGIQNIKSFIVGLKNDSILNQNQLKYYKKLRGSIEDIDTYLNDYLNNSKNIENNIQNILYIIGRLSNNQSEKSNGTILSDFIPKQWKLSDLNTTHIQDFINNKEFLSHNDIFLESNKYDGFYHYLKEDKYSYCFKELLSFMKQSYTTGIFNLSGDDNSFYTKMYGEMFLRFIFIFLFEKLIEYINSLYDDQSPLSQKANDLFQLLEEKDSLELKDSIRICSQLTFDLLIHFLDEYNDSNWIFQNENISDKISKQKETEKQNIINTLEGKTAEERKVFITLQQQGQINWYEDSDKANLEKIKSNKYGEQLENERIERSKELLLQNQSMLEVSESFGMPASQLTLNQDEVSEQDQGYDPHDADREDEGLDDSDELGDYKEN